MTTAYPSIGVVLGAQWGDEGKGKLTDILGEHYDVCARYNGGSNAGHTIVKNGVKYATHLLPSGILTDDMVSLIGNGVVVHFPTLWKELADLEKGGINWQGRLLISDRAHVVFEFHKIVDGRSEKALKGHALGTTGRGIGPTYAQKMERSGLRVHNLFEEDFPERFRRALSGWEARYGNLGIVAKNVDGSEKKDENGSPVIIPYDAGTVDAEIEYYLQMREKLRPMVVDCAEYLDHALAGGKRLLIESANAIMLDIDHGTYPYVTSSPPSIGGACTGLGLPATKLAKSPLIVGIVKAYTTRVGEGPFPTELDIFQENTAGWVFSTVGREKGTTTGRFRRCGWLDLPVVKYGHRVNGYTHLNLTKLDVLDGLEEIKVCTEYHDKDGKVLTTVPASLVELAAVVPQYAVLPGWKTSIADCKNFAELPINAQNYVLFIQKSVGVHVKWVGVGAASSAIIEDVPF